MDRSQIFMSRTPGGESPELISRRYHLIRVLVTLAVACAITILIGLAALIDPENLHPLRYFGGCAVTGLVLIILLTVLVKKRELSVPAVEAIVVIGLLTVYANTVYGGLLDVDPWWQVCGYAVVIMIAGGVALRRWSSFAFFVFACLFTWIVVINDAGQLNTFIFDTYILMGLGAITAGAILLLFRTERRRVTLLNQELRASASHDPLTGILNRFGLLKTQLARRQEDVRPGTEPVWCAYVDVDYFKRINDLKGHDHGDEVLRQVALALSDLVPDGSHTARWGGDEFVAVGFGEAPEEATLEAAMNEAIAKVEPGGSVSVGIASSPNARTTDVTSLLKVADHRMYERRAQVRERFELTKPKSSLI